MSDSMRDELTKALREGGGEDLLPKESNPPRKAGKGRQGKGVRAGGPSSPNPSGVEGAANHRSSGKRANKAGAGQRKKRAKRLPEVNHGDLSVYRGNQPSDHATVSRPESSRTRKHIGRHPRVSVGLLEAVDAEQRWVEVEDRIATKTQVFEGTPNDTREVNIGLDLGTSSVKVVISDPALRKSFAVPFFDAIGIDGYLLPSRLRLAEGRFQVPVSSDDATSRDIKLAFLGNPKDHDTHRRLIALMALVLRHARGWLFSKHEAVYRDVRILWRITVGHPSSYYDKADPVSLAFVGAAEIAWRASRDPRGVRVEVIDEAIKYYARLRNGQGAGADEEDVQVDGLPEIAAQVYGFVCSTRFDKKDPNHYLMVDVGGGTVDACVFHVSERRAGRWDFVFFESQVSETGAMNLHLHRVRWWLNMAEGVQGTDRLVRDLERIKWPTDRRGGIPDSFLEYVQDFEVELGDGEMNPDQQFLDCILCQVREDTLSAAERKRKLTRDNLRGIPAFYCGGGMRSKFYKQLPPELRSHPGYSYLSAIKRTLERPRDLDAPGVPNDSYDRLAVAYGLSRMDLGVVKAGAAMSDAWGSKGPSTWQSRYVDKDQV